MRIGSTLLVLCVLTVSPTGAVLAQLPVQFESKSLLNKSAVEDPFRVRTAELGSLLNGNTKYEEAKHKELVELASKYLVYRVTWMNVQTDYKPVSTTAMEQVRRDFANYMTDRLSQGGDKNDAVEQALCKEVAQRFDEVFALPFEKNRLAHVNAALMLADFGRTKNLEARSYLVKLIKNPKAHDLIKLFAVKGLGEFFPAREFVPLLEANKKPLVDQRARDAEQIELLVKVIEQNWNLPANAPQQEIDGVHYIRREAIKSLALAGVPAAEVANGAAAPSGIAVVTLMKVCTEDLNPPPSLTEKLEATLGLCRLKKTPTSTYNPDLGVYLVAKTLHEVLSAYNNDYREFAVVKTKSPLTTWKLHAERIKSALEMLANNTRNSGVREDADAVKNAQELQAKADRALSIMKTHGSLSGGEIDNIGQLAARIKPGAAVVFRNLPPMQLKLN